MHRLFVPKQAVGASLVYFDLFNPSTSGVKVRVWSIKPVISGAVAVVASLGVDLYLQRTTAVGTGGTAASAEQTSQTGIGFVGVDNTQGVPGGVSARLTPSGGATLGAVVDWVSVFTEETNSAPYVAYDGMIRHGYTDMPALLVQPGSGIAIVQGSVASVGNIGFNVMFDWY
jgi:hypothetical protein